MKNPIRFLEKLQFKNKPTNSDQIYLKVFRELVMLIMPNIFLWSLLKYNDLYFVV